MIINDNLKKIKILGVGQYSKVYEVLDPITQENMALKRNFTFSNFDGCSNLREVDILARLKGHPFIVDINKVYFDEPFCRDNPHTPRNCGENMKDDQIHFALEKGDFNLKVYLDRFEKDHTYYVRLKLFMSQFLIGLDFLHKEGIVHRDIKPQNMILVNGDIEGNELNDRLKISDFGLSLNMTDNAPSTPGTVTSWYRTPEIAMNIQYDTKSDMWSAGCLIYEMVTGKPLLPGISDSQIDVYSNILGIIDVDDEILDYMWSMSHIDRYHGIIIKNRPKWYTFNINDEEAFNNAELGGNLTELKDLLSRLLVFDPDGRASASEALDMPFFNYNRAYINHNILPFSNPDIELNLVINEERIRMGNIAKQNIFNNRHNIDWYKHRILFHAIELFDRYMYWSYTNHQDLPTVVVKDNFVRIHPDHKQIGIRFCVCLYVSYKYFASLNVEDYSWADFVGYINKDYAKNVNFAKDFEIILLEHVTRYSIYVPTLFEHLPNEKVKTIAEYLDIYTSIPIENNTIRSINLFSMVSHIKNLHNTG